MASTPKPNFTEAANKAAHAKADRETDYSGSAGPIDTNVDKGRTHDWYASESCDGDLNQRGALTGGEYDD